LVEALSVSALELADATCFDGPVGFCVEPGLCEFLFGVGERFDVLTRALAEDG